MKNLLSYVIGFRSRKRNNIVVAAIYYVITLMLAISLEGQFLFALTFFWSAPFVIFSLKDTIKTKQIKKLVTVPICFVLILVATAFSDMTVQPDKIYLSDSEIVFEDINETKLITYKVEPENADVSKIEIVSANPEIAVVEEDILRAVSEGETVLYARVRDNDVESEKISIVVNDKEAQLLRNAQVIMDKIDGIGDVTLESKAAIQAAKSAYDAAPSEVKAKVENYNKISESDMKYQQLEKEEAERIQKEKEEAERLQKEKEAAQRVVQQQTEVSERTVYIGKTGTKYHKQGCRTLKGNGRAISISEAKAQGRTACKVCGG